MSISKTDLNERIRHEKRLAALEVQTEAWTDGISEGIDAEIMALAGMETILTNLMAECGPEAANALLDSVRAKFDLGVFHSIKFRN